jgi:hypothetical protein
MLQDLVTRSEAPFNSAQGRYRIDTHVSRGPGFVPSKIDAGPELAARQAERSAAQAYAFAASLPTPTQPAASIDVPAGLVITAAVIGLCVMGTGIVLASLPMLARGLQALGALMLGA